MSVLTDNIDQILAARRIGKYKFYKDVGISAATFSQWKQGRNDPRLSKLAEVAQYLGVSASTLTDGQIIDFEIGKPEEQKTAVTEGDGMSDVQIELMSIARTLEPDSLRYLTAKARELAEFQRFRDSQ